MLPPKKAVRKGQQGKAVGWVPPTALLSLKQFVAIWVEKTSTRAEQPFDIIRWTVTPG
jgi:hypothetical protein